MSSRNKSFDLVKGLLVLAIIILHFLVHISVISSGFERYFVSYLSFINPMFIMISGYFFYKSNNKFKNFKKLFISYFIYLFLIFIVAFYFDIIFLDAWKDLFLFGYISNIDFWVVKNIIYFMAIVLLFYTEGKKRLLLSIFLFIGFILFYLNKGDYTISFQFFSFLSGFLIAKFGPIQMSKKVNIFLVVFLSIILPTLTRGIIYDQTNEFVLLYCLLVVNLCCLTRIKFSGLDFFSTNILIFLFSQNIVRYYLKTIFLVDQSIFYQFSMFLLYLILTTIIVCLVKLFIKIFYLSKKKLIS